MNTVNTCKIGQGIQPMPGRNVSVSDEARPEKRRYVQSRGVNSWMPVRRAIPAKEFMEKAEVQFYG